MRTRKKKKIIGSRSIIYITIIASLSAMGIGYAAWNDGLSVNMGISTGNIDRSISTEDPGYSGLKYDLSEDGMTLNISGEVYTGYQDEISIGITDNGSIPTILKSVDELDTAQIIDFKEQRNNGNNRLYSMEKEDEDIFQLSIYTEQIYSNYFEQISTFSIQQESLDVQPNVDMIQNKINSVQNQMNNTQNEMNSIQSEIERLYNLREDHNFKYNLKFEQGL